MGGFTSEVLLTMPAFSTSSTFLTVDYLVDLLEVTTHLRGGRPSLLGSANATSSAGAHSLRPLRLNSLPLRKFLDFWIEVDGRIAAAKQLLYIRSQVILIISVKTHRPQLIFVGRRVVGRRWPTVPQRPVQEKSEAENKESSQ
jgi:hypothetical protein